MLKLYKNLFTLFLKNNLDSAEGKTYYDTNNSLNTVDESLSDYLVDNSTLDINELNKLDAKYNEEKGRITFQTKEAIKDIFDIEGGVSLQQGYDPKTSPFLNSLLEGQNKILEFSNGKLTLSKPEIKKIEKAGEKYDYETSTRELDRYTIKDGKTIRSKINKTDLEVHDFGWNSQIYDIPEGKFDDAFNYYVHNLDRIDFEKTRSYDSISQNSYFKPNKKGTVYKNKNGDEISVKKNDDGTITLTEGKTFSGAFDLGATISNPPKLDNTVEMQKLVAYYFNENMVNSLDYNEIKDKLYLLEPKNNQFVNTLVENSDISDKDKDKKLKKMSESPKNYFRGSIEEYQGVLLDYEKDPNLKSLSDIKVPTHGDLHLEQLIFIGNTPKLSDFDESYMGGSITNDLIRILASIKTWGGDESIQIAFLDSYIKSLKGEKVVLNIPKGLELKTNEKPEDLINGNNGFINFKDGKFQDGKDKKDKIIKTNHISGDEKSSIKGLLEEIGISGDILDGKKETSTGVGSLGMEKIFVAVKNGNETKIYELKQQDKVHSAKNLDGENHNNSERQDVAKILGKDLKCIEINGIDYTVDEMAPNYNKFEPKADDKDTISYGANAIAVELANLHREEAGDILSEISKENVKKSLLEKANDFSDINQKSFEINQKYFENLKK